MKWLEQQSDANPTHLQETVDTSPLKLLETMTIKHGRLNTKFTVSKLSGSVGIAFSDSLSIMYPDTNKPPLILSKDGGVHTAALFITISDQEYLAAASEDHIHIWNLERNTSSVAYKFQESGRWHSCVIDERTVACVAEQTSSGHHFSKIYILNTDTEKFNLNNTMRMRADGIISDICYVKTTDGTPCLILSAIQPSRIQCMEIVGGKIRWQVDTQFERSFFPLGIFTDGSTVFVANTSQNVLHLLSLEDGSVLTSINLSPFSFLSSCVRTQGEHLYVGYLNDKMHTCCISKFIKPTDV